MHVNSIQQIALVHVYVLAIVRTYRLQIYILLYYTKHDESKGSRNARGGRSVYHLNSLSEVSRLKTSDCDRLRMLQVESLSIAHSVCVSLILRDV